MSTSIGTSSTPSPDRHFSVGPGSGPASTRTAAPGPARIAVASPWPTSQKATAHSPGQPSGTGRTRLAASSTATKAEPPSQLRSTHTRAAARAADATATAATLVGEAGHSQVDAGSAAPACEIQRMGWAHQPASQPGTTANSPSGLSTAASRPSTVVGPTKGAASTLVPTPTTETRSLIAVTIGCVASCAASETANASAIHRGHHLVNEPRNTGPSSTIPAHAVTDRANPTERESHGSHHTSTVTARHNARTLRLPGPTPVAASATIPMAVARNTEGSWPHTSTKKPTPNSATIRTHQPRTPTARTVASSTPSRRVRFAPETAIRWVRPVAWKSARIASSTREVSPTTSDGTSAAC